MKEKIRRAERDIEALEDKQSEFVTYKHFDGIIQPLTRALETLESDVKKILHVVSHNQTQD